MTAAYEIRKYTKTDYDVFKEMFIRYFTEDLNVFGTDEEFDKVCKDIDSYTEAQLIFLDLLFENGIEKGFHIYHVDSKVSDWCEKEGYGMIRELYIAPEARKKGCARNLLILAEKHLKNLSVPAIYLTADKDAESFWIKMGYHDSGEICLKNKQKI